MQTLLAVVAVLVNGVVGGASVANLSDAELAAALRGEIPVHTETFTSSKGKSAGRGVAAIVVNRPLSECWATVTHYEDKAEYTPRLKSVAVLDKQPDLVHVRMEVDASVTTARYTAWFRLDEAQHHIKWTLDHQAKDNTIADVEGEYRLYELAGDRTLMVYQTWVDSGHAVPRFIQDYMARKSLPNMLKAVKQRIESGGSWRKS